MSIFGLKVIPKAPVLRPRPVPKLVDVQGPGSNTCGRIARHPNECYNVLQYDYTQKKRMYEDDIIFSLLKKGNEEAILKKYGKHNENKAYQRLLNEKVRHKLEEYEEKINKRRKKLSEILWKEERELVKEVIEVTQKAATTRIEKKVEKLNKIKDQNENERLAVVKEKKIQQYLARCAEFRPAIIKQRMNESKQIQLIQMKENESKRQKEEEEEQDRLKKAKLNNEFKFYAELQAKEKIGQEQKRQQEILEDRAQLDKLKREQEEEEKTYQKEKHKQKTEMRQLFKDQLQERKNMLDRIAKQDLEIQKAYDKLADEEIAKERAAIKGKISTANEDMHKFQQYLADLKKQKAEEEQNTKKILKETMKALQKKHEDKKCEEERARKALQELVQKERANQIALHKKQEAELKKAIELENRLEKESREHTNRLKLEYERRNQLAAKKYREDLQQQVAYSRVLKERERDNMKKILDAAVTENETYDSIVSNVLSGNIKISETHPFRGVILNDKCPCPKPNY